LLLLLLLLLLLPCLGVIGGLVAWRKQ